MADEYGSMRAIETEDVLQAPGLGLLEDVALTPLVSTRGVLKYLDELLSGKMVKSPKKFDIIEKPLSSRTPVQAKVRVGAADTGEQQYVRISYRTGQSPELEKELSELRWEDLSGQASSDKARRLGRLQDIHKKRAKATLKFAYNPQKVPEISSVGLYSYPPPNWGSTMMGSQIASKQLTGSLLRDFLEAIPTGMRIDPHPMNIFSLPMLLREVSKRSNRLELLNPKGIGQSGEWYPRWHTTFGQVPRAERVKRMLDRLGVKDVNLQDVEPTGSSVTYPEFLIRKIK